ncbi:MAG TPA: DnaJ domain-containing protein, partial [Chthonomonadales bacterium]|nr:DnaJ domain-containing protein [Chthonomonadales bacterium]
ILKWHPDVNPENLEDAHERAVRFNEAWEVLEDPAARREYDEHLRAMRAAAAEPQAPPPQPSSSASRAPGPPPFVHTASERPTQEWSATQTAQRARAEAERAAPVSLGEIGLLWCAGLGFVALAIHFATAFPLWVPYTWFFGFLGICGLWAAISATYERIRRSCLCCSLALGLLALSFYMCFLAD